MVFFERHPEFVGHECTPVGTASPNQIVKPKASSPKRCLALFPVASENDDFLAKFSR
jgi:hypothetical protein